jgi:hypothetical protein
MGTQPLEKKRDVGLKSRHVFLDTEVYRRYGYNLKNRVLETLLKHIKEHVCILHITDVTLCEVRRQIGDMAAELAQAVNKANKDLRRWQAVRTWNITLLTEERELDAATLTNDAILRFNEAISSEWSPIKHEALDIPAKDIFESYFRRNPPFDTKDSKEFPDAFVVTCLDRWCDREHQKMYVITKDKAMLRAVEQTKALIALPTVEDYLSIIVEAQHPTILDKVKGILGSSSWNDVDKRVRAQIGQLGSVYSGDLYDGEVLHHELTNAAIELIDFKVISVSHKQIEVVAKVKVPVSFDVKYLDVDPAWYDDEAPEYVGEEPRRATFRRGAVIMILALIDAVDEHVIEVDILTRELRLEESYHDRRAAIGG